MELFMNDRRIDGRRSNELRKIDIERHESLADGAILLSQGNTKILASVFGPRVCAQKINQNVDGSIICCSFEKPSLASVSLRVKSTTDRLLIENATIIEDIFRNVIVCKKYPNSQIDILIQVLESDGGELSCAINAACLALVDAGIEIFYFVTSSTVGLYSNNLLADICRFEEQIRMPQLNLVFIPEQDTTVINSVNNAEKLSKVLPSSILHVSMCSWVISKDLRFMISEASKVAQTVYEHLSSYCRNNILSNNDYNQAC